MLKDETRLNLITTTGRGLDPPRSSSALQSKRRRANAAGRRHHGTRCHRDRTPSATLGAVAYESDTLIAGLLFDIRLERHEKQARVMATTPN